MTTVNLPLEPRRQIRAQSFHNDSELAALGPMRSHAQEIRLRRGQPLPSASVDSVYVVRSGLVAVKTAAVHGRRPIVELLYPGDLFVPSHQPPSASAQCSTMAATELWRVNSSVFKNEMAKDAGVADYVFRRLNQQRARMQLHITILAGLTSEERVAALLLQAGCRLGSSAGGAISFDMPLSRDEIAEYLALNADTLSRIMSRLSRDSIIGRSSRAQLAVHNWEALKALCPLSEAVIALHSSN